jgi:Uma2 family endonuclease
MVAPQKTISQYVVLRNTSWETFEQLLADNQDSAGVRLYYDNGMLEIKAPSAKHEKPNRTLALLIEELAVELDLDLELLGSTTYKRDDLLKGFEPDSSFYIQNAEAVRGKDEIDLVTDPPPDLVIEVDITSYSLNKFPIFAGLGIPEVWRYDNTQVGFYKLEGDSYVKVDHSPAFPMLTSEMATQLLNESAHMKNQPGCGACATGRASK